MLVRRDDPEVAQWIATEVGIVIHPPFAAFTVMDGKSIRGSWVWHEFYPGGNIEMTVVGRRCWTPAAVKNAFRYAFDTCGCSRVTARTQRRNELVKRLLPRLGFKFETTQKFYFGPTRADDGLVFVMFRHDAEKWLQ